MNLLWSIMMYASASSHADIMTKNESGPRDASDKRVSNFLAISCEKDRCLAVDTVDAPAQKGSHDHRKFAKGRVGLEGALLRIKLLEEASGRSEPPFDVWVRRMVFVQRAIPRGRKTFVRDAHVFFQPSKQGFRTRSCECTNLCVVSGRRGQKLHGFLTGRCPRCIFSRNSPWFREFR